MKKEKVKEIKEEEEKEGGEEEEEIEEEEEREEEVYLRVLRGRETGKIVGNCA